MMRELFYQLKEHKPKHNLNYWLELKDVDGDGDLSIHFTIFVDEQTQNKYNMEHRNNFIVIYSFNEKDIMQKANKIKKLLNNKRKAILFIKGDYK